MPSVITTDETGSERQKMPTGAVVMRAIWISTDQMRSLMRIADGVGVARLVLVGDTRRQVASDAVDAVGSVADPGRGAQHRGGSDRRAGNRRPSSRQC